MVIYPKFKLISHREKFTFIDFEMVPVPLRSINLIFSVQKVHPITLATQNPFRQS